MALITRNLRKTAQLSAMSATAERRLALVHRRRLSRRMQHVTAASVNEVSAGETCWRTALSATGHDRDNPGCRWHHDDAFDMQSALTNDWLAHLILRQFNHSTASFLPFNWPYWPWKAVAYLLHWWSLSSLVQPEICWVSLHTAYTKF